MTAMGRVWDLICSPGAKQELIIAAPTQSVILPGDKPNDNSENVQGLEIKEKQRILDRWLDAVVRASGSGPVFTVILLGLLAWAFLGIPFFDSVDWQVVISDVQAILCYIFDSLLMRQQLNTYDDGLSIAAQLQSRGHSHARMLEKVNSMLASGKLVRSQDVSKSSINLEQDLPKDSRFGRLVSRFSVCYGHILTIIVYWATIFLWLGFGPVNDWSDSWQLYMNSATSALMVFTFAFLANIRERHSTYSKKCTDATFRIDSALEARLRLLTHDDLDNAHVVIAAPKMNVVQRAIYYYADIVGTLVGIALLFIVIIAWVAIGPLLEFNANWWLIIGTYAGLIGLNDGFVLLNVQNHLRKHETLQLAAVDELDTQIFHIAARAKPVEKKLEKDTLSFRLSLRMSTLVSRVCAHESAVVMDLVLIIGLLTGSSVMGWNTTGQLLSNVPPSIIEAFLMIILIPAHNSAESERRVQMENFFERRLELISFVDSLEAAGTEKTLQHAFDVTELDDESV